MGSQPTGSRRSAPLTEHELAISHWLRNSVIIKGTQVYDNSKGSFVDLSVLDVLQVFGRAGRPGFETSGQGFICTTGDKLQHYLDAVTSQVGKSRIYFDASLSDNMCRILLSRSKYPDVRQNYG